MSEDFFSKAVPSLACSVIVLAITETRAWFRARRDLVKDTAERYITEARPRQGDTGFRMGAMQRAGVAKLSPRQIRKFCTEVMDRGCIDPFTDLVVGHHFSLKEFPSVLREATRKGILFSDDEGLLDFLFVRFYDAKDEKAQKERKGS